MSDRENCECDKDPSLVSITFSDVDDEVTNATIRFHVPSIPIAQPRQRSAVIAGHVRTYTPTKHPVNGFKASVQSALASVHHGPPLEGPLRLMACFVLPRPKNKIWKTRDMPRLWHAKKPDVDNLLKSLKDAMTGLAWRDDSQVCYVSAVKVVADGDEQPHVEVEVEVIGD